MSEKKLSEIERRKIWMQGYICAIAKKIHVDGVDARTRELFFAAVGNKTLETLRQEGINQNDMEILDEHWAELYT